MNLDMTMRGKILAGWALVLLMAVNLPGQSIFSDLTGVVADPAGAVIPGAKVTLRDAQSGSQRDSVSNNEGYFAFASVPVGSYILTVESKGFETYKLTGIEIAGGEKRNVNISLKVGSTSETVEVSSQSDTLVPVDNGEKSFTLSTKELQTS
jgi:hypothetical protein